jgi:hypothetical protein
VEDGNNSAAKASASSGVCLYLKVSRAPDVWDGAGLAVLERVGCAGFCAGFFAAEAVLPTAGVFLGYL